MSFRRNIPMTLAAVCALLTSTCVIAADSVAPPKADAPAAKPAEKPAEEPKKADDAQAEAPQVIIIQGGTINVQVQVQGGGNAGVKVEQDGQVVVEHGLEAQKRGNSGAERGIKEGERGLQEAERGNSAPKDKPAAEVKARVQMGVRIVAAPAGPDGPAAAPAEPKDAKKKEDELGGVSSVYFHVERDIGARLRKAAQLVAAKRLDAAFDMYLYVLENGAEGLFQLDDNRYLGVREHCLRSIAGMPQELLGQYRLRVDGEVSRLFESLKGAPDPEELDKLGARFFLSTPGPEILDLAGDVYAGRGDWGRAVSCWQRVLRWSRPETWPEGSGADRSARGMIEAKAALGLARMGQVRDARAMLADLLARGDGTTLVLGGTPRKLAEFLDAELPRSAAAASATAASRTHWPQFGGEAGHAARLNDIFSCDVKVGELTIPAYDAKGAKGAPPATYDPWGRPVAATSPASPFAPVYADGRVYIHDDSGVMAFRPGGISAEWLAGEMGGTGPKPGRPDPNMAMMGVPAMPAEPRTYACAYEAGVVYASLNRAPSGPEIWALSDRGKLLWRDSRTRVGFEWLGEGAELSDPVVSEGALYLLAFGSDQFRRECWLVCLDAADGELRWRRFLCSGVRLSFRRMYGIASTVPVLALPAVRDGIVVACSGVGGLVGVDARTGDVLWGFAYEQSAVGNPMMFMQQQSGRAIAPPASHSTPVLRDGVAYVMPTDSDRVYAVEAVTGKCLWRTPRGDHAQIAGVTDRAVLVSGKSVAALSRDDGRETWSFDKEDFDYSGAAFLTGDALYVPGAKAICRIDPVGGKLLSRVMTSRAEGEYGNLLLVEDAMVQVGRKVHFYGLWDRVYAGIESDIRRDSKDPDPHVRLGALYARKDDGPRAIASYEKSLSLTTGPDDAPAARRREEVNKRLYGLYAAEVSRAIEGGRLDRALTCAERNLTYAGDDTTRTEAVLRLVDIHERRSDWAGAIGQLQSLIQNPPGTAYTFEGGSSMLPSLHAQLRIRELIAAHGRGAYAAFEEEARRLTAKGLKSDIEKILTAYPNSAAARRAMARLADMEAADGQYRRASRYLSDYLRASEDGSADDAVQVRWRLAHYLERDGQYGMARRTLASLAKDFPDAMVGSGEDRRTLAETVSARLAEPPYTGTAQREIPGAFSVPLKETRRLPFGGQGVLVRRGSTVFFGDQTGRLRSLDLDTGKSRWSAAMPAGYVAVCLAKGDRVLAAGQGFARLMDADTGEAVWSYTVPAGQRQVQGPQGAVMIPIANTVSGADFNERYAALVLTGMTREVAVLDMQSGKQVWRAELPGHPMWAPAVSDDYLVVTTNVGFSVYELATGRRTVEINNRAPRRGTILLDSGRIVAAEMQRLVCYDIATGKTEWSVACQAASLNNSRFEGTVTVDGKACLLVPTVDRRVMCVDLENGRPLWTQAVGGNGDQIVGLSVEGDATFVFAALMLGNKRSARVSAVEMKTGNVLWTGEAIDGAYPRDWEVGKDYIAVLGDVYKIEQQGNAVIPRALDPMVYCIDRASGKTVQSLALKTGDPNMGIRPARLIAAEDMVWAMYYDKFIGLQAAK